MFKLNYLTRENSLPDKKPKVYFTCHSDDFDTSFEMISRDILEAFDCAVYYAENMGKHVYSDNIDELSTYSLFVVPITLKLLTKPNIAMELDINYAKENHIPILPIMLERGIEPIYLRSELFKDMQYLDINYENSTEISYNEKLTEYLSSLFPSKKIADRALDAAKKLGDSLDNASPENKYLMGVAYFNGIGVDIDRARGLALMEQAAAENFIAANDTLYEFYIRGIYVDVDYTVAFNFAKRLFELCTEADGEKSESALSASYKLAKGYLCIGNAKEAINTCWEATKVLEDVLSPTHPLTKKIFLRYAQYSRLFESFEPILSINSDIARYYCVTPEVNNVDKLVALTNLALVYRDSGDDKTALDLLKNIYKDFKTLLGEEHPMTLTCLDNIASVKCQFKKYKEALKIIKPLYEVKCRVFGEDNPHTLDTLNDLAMLYSNLGKLEKAKSLYEKVISLTEKKLGYGHPDMLATLENLLDVFTKLGDRKNRAFVLEKLYNCQKILFGEYSIENVNIAQIIAALYINDKCYPAAIRWLDVVYKTTEGIPEYAEDAEEAKKQAEFCIHRINDKSLEEFKKGNISSALLIQNEVCDYRCIFLGALHRDTLISKNDIAVMNYKLGNIEEALECFDFLYKDQCEVFGNTSDEAMNTLNNLVSISLNSKKYRMAVGYLAKKYDAQYKAHGNESVESFETVDMLFKACLALIEENDTVIFSNQFLADYNGKVLGILRDMSKMLLEIEEYSKASCVYKILYRYYSETDGENSKNALEIKAKLDDVLNK